VLPTRSIPFSSGKWTQVGLFCSAAALVALHLLQPDRAPAASPIGTYALGEGGLVTILAYLALALALASAAIGGLQVLPAGAPRLLAALCLGLGALGTLVSGIFPSDGSVPPTAPGSPDGWIHLVASLSAAPFYLLGPLAFTLGTRGDPRWDGIRRPMVAVATGLGAALAFLGLGAVGMRLTGAAERSLVALLLLWLLLAGRRIQVLRRRTVEGPGGEPPG
jgi:hypothetical protein